MCACTPSPCLRPVRCLCSIFLGRTLFHRPIKISSTMHVYSYFTSLSVPPVLQRIPSTNRTDARKRTPSSSLYVPFHVDASLFVVLLRRLIYLLPLSRELLAISSAPILLIFLPASPFYTGHGSPHGFLENFVPPPLFPLTADCIFLRHFIMS